MGFEPCPFCGRQPHHTQRGRSPYEYDSEERSLATEIHFLSCNCGGYSARAHQFGYTLEDVTKKWNTRFTSPALDSSDPRRTGPASPSA